MKKRKQSPRADSPVTNWSRLAHWRTSGPNRTPSSSSNRTLGIRQRRSPSEHSGAMTTAKAMTNTDMAVS